MGTAFAQRLAAAGFRFAGYDVDAAKAAQIAERLAARRPVSIAEIARECDPIPPAVSSTDQVEEVVEKHCCRTQRPLGPHRALRLDLRSRPIAALGVRVAARGLRFLETPVSGTSAQVARGEGVGLIGGDPTVTVEIEPVLRALFPTDFLIGRWAMAAGPSWRSISFSV